MLAIYSIRKLPNGDERWQEVGVAFLNSDGSINLKFDLFPTAHPSTKLQLREKKVYNETD